MYHMFLPYAAFFRCFLSKFCILYCSFQLIFDGSVEQGYEGDISIDDFRIQDGTCGADMSSQEITPKPLSSEERTNVLNNQLERYRKMMRRRQRLRQKTNKNSAET